MNNIWTHKKEFLLGQPHAEFFSWQEKFISEIVANKSKLSDALVEKNLSYDDLRYQFHEEIEPETPRFSFENYELKQEKKIPVVSFFSGGGGLDLGFEKAGFDVIACIEHNETFCKTLRRNFPEKKIFGPPDHSGDVSKVDEVISDLEQLGVKTGFNGVFIGGPPCQPFSIAANQRFNKNGENYKRVGFSHPTNGGLLFDYVKLIEHFMPSAFLIENVPGIVELDGGEQVRSLYAILEQAGYHMASPQLLDTSEFGIPQNRKRVFIIGSRKKKVTWALEKVNKKQRSIDYLQNINENLQNTETRLHAASSVQRYMYMAYGQREKLGRVDRIDPYLPSKTIIAGGSSGGGRSHLHPFSPRTMSVRESARLQTFPDWFVFEGPSARQFNQVGNAVPPVLAAMLANQIIQKLF